MGGHSDSEGRRSHSKKKRSHSRSPKRHKKSFRRHSRSNSRSPVRRRSRSLSSNRKKYHSKSKSPHRRLSRSRSPPRRRSRSKSSSRRRSRTKSPVSHHSRSKSPIKSSKSKEKQMKHKEQSHGALQGREKTGNRKKENKINKDPDINLTGFEDLLPAEQAKIRMKLALCAAVAADIPSKDQKNEDKIVHKISVLEQIDRTKAIEAINDPEFHQQSFKSKQEDKDCEKKDLHSEAMFGEAKLEPSEVITNHQKSTQVYSNSLAHPNLFEDIAEKEERWRKKLSAMRQCKLNEENLF